MVMDRPCLYPYELLKSRAAISGNEPGAFVLRLGDKEYQDFHPLTWAQIFKRVKQYGQFLRSLHLSPGDRIAISARNGIEWVTLDWAAISCGLVTVPIFLQSHPDEVGFIILESESKVLFCDTPIAGLAIDQLQLADVERSIENLDGSFAPSPMAADALATIIYTSGTSGKPKGVMHSLSNIYHAFYTANQWFQLSSNDRLVSYLPLSHVVERMLIEFGMLFTGLRPFFIDKVDRLPKELPRVRPTVFLSVPRIWDLIRSRIERDLKSKEGGLVMSVLPSLIKRFLIRKAISRKLGLDATRYFVSGAAKLSSETAQSFLEWGISIHEAYGLTETLCISAANPPGSARLGTVGKIYPGVESRISSDGEICLKAPFHFMGYYKQPELTSEVLQEGWFQTGDVGVWDENGYLKITDRKKDLFKTTNGKYIAPLAIEVKLKTHPGIKEVIVVGDGKPHCVALASIDRSLIGERELLDWVETVNQTLSPHEQVRSIGYVTTVWSADSGELTPSLKLKRRVILERYRNQIEELFENRTRVKFLEPAAVKTENEFGAHLSV